MPYRMNVLVIAAASVVVLQYSQPTSAATAGHGQSFVVTDERDLPDLQADGRCQAEAETRSCTLRAALDEINAAGGHHRVRIGRMSITLSLQDGGLVVSPGVRVSVSGAGPARTTIDGGGPAPGVPIFSVAAGAALDLEGLTLSNGVATAWGGAVLNGGDVYISDAVLSGNRATASGLGGPAGRGGAIFNQPGGRLALVTTTLADNQSRGSGGAVRNEGFMIVVGSTFSGNDGFAGGGGAIANSGLIYVLNSTLSGNHSAGAGAIWNEATGRLFGLSLTLADNFTHTGGPWTTIDNAGGGVAWLANTIIASGQPGTNCVGQLTSGGFNVSNDDSCGLHALGDWQSVDPGLAPLADNGGPTQTHALVPGSQVIDQGFCFGFNFDQRGYRRPIDIAGVANAANGCDIGAFEVQRRESH